MKVAVVTGASSGVGKALAENLIADGWKVYGVSRTDPGFTNEHFVWRKCDLARPSDIPKKLIVEEPTIDLLVSNAGVAFTQPAADVSVESYAEMYDVNVRAPMLVVALLRDRIKGATVITISSVSDRLAGEGYALYCSSKAANTRYFETLALELEDATVISLSPDYIDTPMLRKLQEGQDFDWGQALKSKEIAELVRDLESGKTNVESGSTVIVVNDQMIEDLQSAEKLYGYNVSNGILTRL